MYSKRFTGHLLDEVLQHGEIQLNFSVETQSSFESCIRKQAETLFSYRNVIATIGNILPGGLMSKIEWGSTTCVDLLYSLF